MATRSDRKTRIRRRDYTLNYTPDGEVLRQFLKCRDEVMGIMGPIGSGKSSAACIKIYDFAKGQAPDREGVRRTRWAIVRNTSSQLKLTTIKTWLRLFPDGVLGDMRWSPPLSYILRHDLGDGTRIECEVLFMALDDPAAVQNLYSLELTGFWVNEAQFVDKSVIDTLVERSGRYPEPNEDGSGGPTWYGGIMDTNAPPEEHWWPIMVGDKSPPEWMSEEDQLTFVKPEGWTFFRQPPAVIEKFDGAGKLIGYEVNPKAENLKFLPLRYYERAMKGKKRSHIERNMMNKYGQSFAGKPVHSSFRRERNVAKGPIVPLAGAPIYVGIDFGRTPAAVFFQRRMTRWFGLREIVTEDMGARQFARMMRLKIAEWFPDHKDFLIFGDPAGEDMAQTDDVTPFMMLAAERITARPAPTNDWGIRREAVDNVLARYEDQEPCLLISPLCPVLIEAMEGGYRYRQIRGAGGHAYYEDRPQKKGRHSHVAEALQYCLLGGGEGREVARAPRKAANDQFGQRPGGYNVMNRQRGIAARPVALRGR